MYGATANAAESSLTITVSFSSTGYNGVICADSKGYGLTPSGSESKSLALTNATTSHAACALTVAGPSSYDCFSGISVPSLTTTSGDLVVSMVLGYSCGPTLTWGPLSSTGFEISGFYSPLAPNFAFMAPFANGGTISTATSCGASTFTMFGDASISGPSTPALCSCPLIHGSNLGWGSGGSTIANYTGIETKDLITGANSANWVELAADFPAKTGVVIGTGTGTGTITTTLTSIGPSGTTTTTATSTYTYTTTTTTNGEAITLGISHDFGNLVDDTNSLTPIANLADQLLTEPMSLFLKHALPSVQEEQDCLGVATNVNNATYTNSGPQCGQKVIQGETLVLACNFFQFQCWAYPITFLGMYDAFFIGAALAFRFSEKGFLYFTLAGMTLGSLTEIQLGIMTPMVPIMLIVVNVAYSFRLDRLVTGGGTSGGAIET